MGLKQFLKMLAGADVHMISRIVLIMWVSESEHSRTTILGRTTISKPRMARSRSAMCESEEQQDRAVKWSGRDGTLTDSTRLRNDNDYSTAMTRVNSSA